MEWSSANDPARLLLIADRKFYSRTDSVTIAFVRWIIECDDHPVILAIMIVFQHLYRLIQSAHNDILIAIAIKVCEDS